MKDQQDQRTLDLFPVESIVTKLRCTAISLKTSKDETRISMAIKAYTNARFETDLCNDDYLIGAAEMLVSLCCDDVRRAKSFIDQVAEKYTVEDLCDMACGAKRPVVSGGNISMTFSTAVPFDIESIIVEKETMIKLIAQWVLMLAKGDVETAKQAVNTGYVRIVNQHDSGLMEAA